MNFKSILIKEVPMVKLKINFNCNFLFCIENNTEWVNDI